MNVIFLDVDGVLNCVSTDDTIRGFTGIDTQKIKLLRRIVEVTDAVLVLSSTWKDGWEKSDKSKQDVYANYLDEKLRSESLIIFDKTTDVRGYRGLGIIQWLQTHGVNHFVILDDNNYDFAEHGLSPYHIKTEFYNNHGGLRDEHVSLAIKLLSPEREVST